MIETRPGIPERVLIMPNDALSRSKSTPRRRRGQRSTHREVSARTHSRLGAALYIVLAGGSLFGACEARFRDAVVFGSQDYLLSLLDPAVIVGNILDTPTGEGDSNGLP